MPHSHHANPKPDLSKLPQAGETFGGKYRIEGVLGYGGMGIVFAATHLSLGQRVAIKMLLPEWVDDPAVAARFAREGRASAAIRSEHIARVLDVDECDGRPYLVLEYLEGKDFAQLVEQYGALPVTSAIDLVLQACEALAEAHSLGTIHRDLKPANLFLSHRADGTACVKVLDFGISKVTGRRSVFVTEHTEPLTVLGSPHYMSPEQMKSATDVDARTDIWSLGAILHELLAGKPPFDGDTITALCARVLSEPPPPLTRSRPDVPPGLESIVLRCLEKDRARRFANVADLARALAEFGSDSAHVSATRISRVLEGGIERARATPSAPNADRAVSDISIGRVIKRPVGGYALAALAVVALLGGVGWKIGSQAIAIHASEHEKPREELVPAATLAVPPIAPVAPITAPVPTSVASTTSALVPAPAATIAAPRPPSNALSAAPAAVVIRPPHRHYHVHHVPAAPAAEPADSPPADATPVAAAPPPVLPIATPAPPDPNALFDERK